MATKRPKRQPIGPYPRCQASHTAVDRRLIASRLNDHSSAVVQGDSEVVCNLSADQGLIAKRGDERTEGTHTPDPDGTEEVGRKHNGAIGQSPANVPIWRV